MYVLLPTKLVFKVYIKVKADKHLNVRYIIFIMKKFVFIEISLFKH